MAFTFGCAGGFGAAPAVGGLFGGPAGGIGGGGAAGGFGGGAAGGFGAAPAVGGLFGGPAGGIGGGGAAGGGLFGAGVFGGGGVVPFGHQRDPNNLGHDGVRRYLNMPQLVHESLERVRQLLHASRNPVPAQGAAHTFGDKYVLMEFVASGALSSSVWILAALGLNAEVFARAKEWAAAGQAVSLVFTSTERVTPDGEATRKVEAGQANVTSVSDEAGTTNVTNTVVTNITEYFLAVTLEYELSLCPAMDASQRVVLSARRTQGRIKTPQKPEGPSVKQNDPIDVDIAQIVKLTETWDDAGLDIHIDRTRESCKTPMVNDDIVPITEVFTRLARWTWKLMSYFEERILPLPFVDVVIDAAQISGVGVFSPVLPLFEKLEVGGGGKGKEQEAQAPKSVNLSSTDLRALLKEERRTLGLKQEQCQAAFASDTGIITSTEAWFITLLLHWNRIANDFRNCALYVENMIITAFSLAIGGALTSDAFNTHMHHHNRKLFAPAYAPKAFRYAVRRPNCYPEGTISLVTKSLPSFGAPGNVKFDDVYVFTRTIEPTAPEAQPTRFALNGTTDVNFTGTTHVHAFTAHRFANELTSLPYELHVTARQFSSFIVLLGRMGERDVFLPKHAILVQNKDDLIIPLNVALLPSAKDFEDLMQELSPEQQDFARAYRMMQLDSTLFAICVVQVKPHLERVLNLPEGALTKEVELTQDILELFTEYHVPSDLLAFTDSGDCTVHEKVAAVKEYVARMHAIVERAKQEELEEAERRATAAEANARATAPTPFAGSAAPAAGCFSFGNAASPAVTTPLPAACATKSPPAAHFGTATPLPAASRYDSDDDNPVAFKAAPAAGCSLGPGQGFGAGKAVGAGNAGGFGAANAFGAGNAGFGGGFGVGNVFGAGNAGFGGGFGAANAFGALPVLPAAPAVGGAPVGELNVMDLPHQLERRFSALDTRGCLQPGVIAVVPRWQRKCCRNLIATPCAEVLDLQTLELREKRRALDLLDAITRSGLLTLHDVDLHIILPTMHAFDTTLMDTIVRHSANPVPRIEESTLLVAATVHGVDPALLVRGESAAAKALKQKLEALEDE